MNNNVASLWLAVAAALSPPEHVRPSTWATNNIVLTREMSPVKPGPFDVDWKPWTRDIHDGLYDRPGKKGMICIKPAQTGVTRAQLNNVACTCDTNPQPILYLISDIDQADHFATEHFRPVIENHARLKVSFARSAQSRQRKTRQMPYIGGRIDFAGGGTISSVASRTYVPIYIDEYELVQDNFPKKKTGDVWQLCQGRQQAVESRGTIIAWSHPRLAGQGIHELWTRLSDQSDWVWDCPHCHKTIVPRWDLVRFPDVDEIGTVNPDAAQLHCPHCDQVITDAQRAEAVWAPRLGGTGRFESQLDEEKANQRDYWGPAIHRLSDPDITVRSLARRFVACIDAESLLGFFTIGLGEAPEVSKKVLTRDLIASRVKTVKQIAVPGGRWGAAYMTVGVDVQFPRENPTLYSWASCWSPSGMEYVVDLVKLKGWAALITYLRMLQVDVSMDGRVVGQLCPRVCAIDSGFATSEVLDFCRRRVDSEVGHGKVKLLPVRYRPHVRADRPAQMPPKDKRINPMKPRLGPIDHWDLHRNTWVGRRVDRVYDGRMVILCQVPPDFANQMTSNVLVPVEDQHGWGDGHEEWEKIKNRRDDWLQSGAYSEVAAAMELDLDRLYERATVMDVRDDRRRDGGERKKRVRREGEIERDAGKGWF